MGLKVYLLRHSRHSRECGTSKNLRQKQQGLRSGFDARKGGRVDSRAEGALDILESKWSL